MEIFTFAFLEVFTLMFLLLLKEKNDTGSIFLLLFSITFYWEIESNLQKKALSIKYVFNLENLYGRYLNINVNFFFSFFNQGTYIKIHFLLKCLLLASDNCPNPFFHDLLKRQDHTTFAIFTLRCLVHILGATLLINDLLTTSGHQAFNEPTKWHINLS